MERGFGCLSINGEATDGELAFTDLEGDGVWALEDESLVEPALLVCFALFLRYFGRTYSSQNACHCWAV